MVQKDWYLINLMVSLYSQYPVTHGFTGHRHITNLIRGEVYMLGVLLKSGKYLKTNVKKI